jgi:hypothetical protein
MSTPPSYIPQGAVPTSGRTPTHQKSWLARNWFWLLIALAVCGAAFLFGIFSLIVGAIRGSDVAKEAVSRAQSNPAIRGHLGAPISEGWFVVGSINVSNSSGNADLAVPLTGPKGKATVYVKAQKAVGKWNYSFMQAAIEGSSERIDLLASAAAEPQPKLPGSAPAADVPGSTTSPPEPGSRAPGRPDTGSSDIVESLNTSTPGVDAEIIQCKRSDGVLNVKIRFHNTSSAAINFYVRAPNTAYDRFYVLSGTRKFPVAKDRNGSYLAPGADSSCGLPGVCLRLAGGQSAVWWAKFVAPPVTVGKVDLITPVTTPFEEVPITDK